MALKYDSTCSMKPWVIIYYLLGDSWNYMPPIFVPSSAKRTTTQVLVIAKINGRKHFFWETMFVISSVPTRNYLFKVSNWNTRIRCENCSRLRMKAFQISRNPMNESTRNFCVGVYFRLWFWLFTSGFDSTWPAAHLSFYPLHFIEFACWKNN